MAYVRDPGSGKFVWVDGVLDDDAAKTPAPLPVGYTPGHGDAAAAAAPFNWLPWLTIVAVLGMVGLWGAYAVRNGAESIHRIRNHAASFDGKQVILKGRVAQVFDVGGSWAYYLQQGGDTIVVFSHGRRPFENQTVTVRGSISMGYLDGVPRPALFASESAR